MSYQRETLFGRLLRLRECLNNVNGEGYSLCQRDALLYRCRQRENRRRALMLVYRPRAGARTELNDVDIQILLQVFEGGGCRRGPNTYTVSQCAEPVNQRKEVTVCADQDDFLLWRS